MDDKKKLQYILDEYANPRIQIVEVYCSLFQIIFAIQ